MLYRTFVMIRSMWCLSSILFIFLCPLSVRASEPDATSTISTIEVDGWIDYKVLQLIHAPDDLDRTAAVSRLVSEYEWVEAGTEIVFLDSTQLVQEYRETNLELIESQILFRHILHELDANVRTQLYQLDYLNESLTLYSNLDRSKVASYSIGEARDIERKLAIFRVDRSHVRSLLMDTQSQRAENVDRDEDRKELLGERIARLSETISLLTVTATENGYVRFLRGPDGYLARVGALVSPGSPIAEILSKDLLEANFWIDQRYRQNIQEGMTVHITSSHSGGTCSGNIGLVSDRFTQTEFSKGRVVFKVLVTFEESKCPYFGWGDRVRMTNAPNLLAH